MIYPVVMAGGIGRRFWPLSTPQEPKQFLPLVNNQKSTLQMAVEEASAWAKKEQLRIVSHQNFKKLLKRQLKTLKPSQFLLEPMVKNTAPCVGWAVWTLYQKDPQATMVVLSADQWIDNPKAFVKDVKGALQFVEHHPKTLVVFGLKPTYPETGYGYIEQGEEHGKNIYSVKRFIEKPNLSKARRLIQTGHHFWNGGIFVWKAKTILDELKTHEPLIYKNLRNIGQYPIGRIYEKMPNISIDYAVMEKAQSVCMVKASFKLIDIGNWKSLSLKRPSRAKQWIQLNSKNCFVDAPTKNVATIGVKDLIIVDSPHGLLVCHRKDYERVKDVSLIFNRI